MARPIKKITKTDFVGTYTEYVYGDGHSETDPPGRPLTRDDVIRASRRAAGSVDRLLRFRQSSAAIASVAAMVRALPDDRAVQTSTFDLGGAPRA